MVTGVRAFDGENALSTLSAILRDEARPIAEVAPDAPPQIEQVVQRCLRKSPDERWQSMQDVRAALPALKHESDSGQLYKPRIPAGPKKARSAKSLIAIAALVVVLAGAGTGGGIWWKRHKAAQAAAAAAAEQAREQEQSQATAAATAAAAPPAQPAPEPPPAEPVEVALTNDNIVEMVGAKVATSVILSQIRSSKTNFNLSPAELIRLTKAHVPAIVIETMRDPKAEHVVTAPPKPTYTPKSTLAQQQSASNSTPSPVTPAPTPVAPPSNPAPVAVAPTPVTVPKQTKATISSLVTDGTPLLMTLGADIPADAPEDTPLRFTVSAAVRTSEGTVIAKGAVATGQIVEAAKKKFLGIGGKMQYRLMQVDAVDGTKLNIRATPSKGQEGPARRQVENPNQKHTKEAIAMAGAQYIGYIDGDQTVSVKK